MARTFRKRVKITRRKNSKKVKNVATKHRGKCLQKFRKHSRKMTGGKGFKKMGKSISHNATAIGVGAGAAVATGATTAFSGQTGTAASRQLDNVKVAIEDSDMFTRGSWADVGKGKGVGGPDADVDKQAEEP